MSVYLEKNWAIYFFNVYKLLLFILLIKKISSVSIAEVFYSESKFKLYKFTQDIKPVDFLHIKFIKILINSI